ncbi:hypothetical protein [Mycobacterium aquaticum]|uniref:Uncharacterized protein n=1 Tax=Mycobacterium aquaticum TaxID=1927124 RepID=A0A1X0A4D3_9MYCO|nr:hypothetical protein [Mycobacterium aquaticum]ORA24874.1 hypothetical protein BST13_33390 [Mycobacterium aquaticum]
MPDSDTGSVTDRLIAWARKYGWRVDDRRPTAGVVWFKRGLEYAHLGTDREGARVLSAYGGVQGRPVLHWAASRDHARELANHLRAEPHRY